MIFTKFNLVAFFVLLAINIIPVYRSHRRKRFAFFSTKLFVLPFAAYWLMLLFSFQTFDFMNLEPVGQRAKKGLPKYETTFNIKTNYEDSTVFKIRRLNKVMTIAAIQAIVVLLFSLFGMLWLNDRLEYYTRIVLIFTVLLSFCIWVVHAGSIYGYSEITQ